MKALTVNEIFYSLQGEGHRAGTPSIFIRLAGCDLACGFCDTEFKSGVEMEPAQIYDRIKIHPCKWIVWTGGEPALQLDAEIVKAFKELRYQQAIETNGNNPIPPGLDWVVCSPKVADHVLVKNFPEGVDELRYVRHAGQPGIPQPGIPAKQYFLSPVCDGERLNMENVRHCIDLCLKHPQWRLSLQTHKLLKIL